MRKKQNELLAEEERISKAMCGGDYDERCLQKGITGGVKKCRKFQYAKRSRPLNITQEIESISNY